MCKNLHVSWLTTFVLIFFPLELISTPLPLNVNDVEIKEANIGESSLTCDPLETEGTALLCFPPEGTSSKRDIGNPRNCSHPSVPGTIASYACRNAKGDVYTGFLNCANSGVWIISLHHANNSLCNLDASIVNFEAPDVVIATDVPAFTTPSPNETNLQEDVSFLNEHEKMALQLHNIFRRNHRVPHVRMTKQLNNLAQQLVDSITSSGDIDDLESTFHMDPIHRTMNVEMNWYFQVPSSHNFVEAASTAVQMWYSGFRNYDWEQVERNLETGEALAFSRVIWKATQLIGVGIASSDNITFVACVYTPGRNIISTDPVSEFKDNVPHFRVGPL